MAAGHKSMFDTHTFRFRHLTADHFCPQNLSSRLPEGKQLLNIVQEAFTKATHLTPHDKQAALHANMQDLRKSWDKFTANVQNTMDLLKAAVARWEEYNEQIAAFEKWLDDSERSLADVPDTHGELSEMKTNLERYKQLAEEIGEHGAELRRLANDAVELGNWSKAANKVDDVNRLQVRWDKLNADCTEKVAAVGAEIAEYNAYYQQLVEAEKWLLQISFQLMAHNSLYITNRDQTLEQIAQHEALLNEIQKYQTDIDDLKAKGHNQIERYEESSPSIRGNIETQLKNVQDSYDSLLNTAVQIRQRLQESLGKFEEYENILDSIAKNLDEYEVAIGELETPATTLEMAQGQLKAGNQLHNKLHGEKSRLAIAVQACEAATASISRPSSPLEPNIPLIPEKELTIRAKLEDLIDQVRFQGHARRHFHSKPIFRTRNSCRHCVTDNSAHLVNFQVQNSLSGLSTTINELQQLQKQRDELEEWIRKQEVQVNDWASRPNKLRSEAAKQEIIAMNDLLNAIGDKRSQLMTEMTGSCK